VRRLGVDGIIMTVAGTGYAGFSGDDGPASDAELDAAAGLALDPNGNLYIADQGNGLIRRVDQQTGVITTLLE
jgi:DNA-binding beta-propeller fold protein YncE